MDFIRRLRSKPKHVRTRYALLVSGAITGVIAIFWISSLPAQLSQLAVTQEKDAVSEGATGLADLLNETRDQFGNIMESTNQLEEKDTESSDTPPSSLEALGRNETLVEVEESETFPEAPVVTPQKIIPTSMGPRVIMIGTTTVRQ